MDHHYTYFLILAISLAGPLLLSFDKKVAFYKKWRSLFSAMLFPAFFYIVWDIFFTYKAVWSFNEDRITGVKLANLPVEELLFFFIVPYCCVFIYECILVYFPVVKHNDKGDIILKILAMALLIPAVIFYDKCYTSWTFIFTAISIAVIYRCRSYFRSFNATAFIVAYLVILLPFLIVNGFLTAIPVVQYNNAENLGVKVYSIPLEDIFYGFLLILMNVVIYEKLRPRH